MRDLSGGALSRPQRRARPDGRHRPGAWADLNAGVAFAALRKKKATWALIPAAGCGPAVVRLKKPIDWVI
jgi:hypothetical protein